MLDQIDIMLEFFGKGGPVLIGVFFLSLLLWILILERYWYIFRVYPKTLEEIVNKWHFREDQSSLYAYKIRDSLLTELSIELKHNLAPIKAITAVLPLLGLLGTVTGLIAIFDVMNPFGTGNARGMADGISRALLPTTAGLVTSIIGIYIGSDLSNRVKNKELKAKEQFSN